MADIIGAPTTYKVAIPAFADPADIQTAFKLYHYGSSTVPANYAAIVTDTSGDIGVAGHLKHLNENKAPLAGPTFTGTVSLPSTTSIGNVSATEIGYLDGVTSAIQGQIDLKAPLASPTFTGTVVLPNSTVTTAMINNLAVTTDKLAATAVTEAKIANGAITNAKLSDASINNVKIQDGTIQNAKLANKSITINGQSVDLGGTVTINSINAASDVVFDALGFSNFSILYNSNNSTTDALAPGTSGYILVSGGSSAAPSWAALEISNSNVVSNAAIAYSKLNLATSIKNSDIAADAAIVDSKLAIISSSGKVTNAAVQATDANTANRIVARDASGNFSAGTITATLNGNIKGNVTADAATNGRVTFSNTTGTTYSSVGKIFVQSSEPATPSTGDIWMW